MESQVPNLKRNIEISTSHNIRWFMDENGALDKKTVTFHTMHKLIILVDFLPICCTILIKKEERKIKTQKTIYCESR